MSNPFANLMAIVCAAGALWHGIISVPETHQSPLNSPSRKTQPENHLHCLIDPIDTQCSAKVDLTLPANTLLIVCSLDQAARHHQVTVSPIDMKHCCECNPAADIQTVAWSTIPHVGSTNSTSEAQICSGLYDDPFLEEDQDQHSPPLNRRFEVPYFCGGSVFNRYVEATPVLTTSDLLIYADVAATPEARVVAQRIADEIGKGLQRFVENEVGQIVDIDGDGRLAIVLSRLTEGPEPECRHHVPVYGCVRATDFVLDDHGFGGDIVYVDPEIIHQDMAPLLAHELAHAAIFSVLHEAQNPASGSLTSMPCWLNEAIAHYVERRIRPDSDNLRQRLAQFQREPHRFPVVIPDEIPCSALRRGPARAAGCLFFESVIRQTGNVRVADLLLNGTLEWSHFSGCVDEFLRNWALEHIRNHSDLIAVELDQKNDTTFDLCGTSFRCIQSGDDLRHIRITSLPDCRLQLTVVHLDQ